MRINTVKFKEILDDFIERRLDGEDTNKINAEYDRKCIDFTLDQIDLLMFHDFLVYSYPEILKEKNALHELLYKRMLEAWVTRASFQKSTLNIMSPTMTYH